MKQSVGMFFTVLTFVLILGNGAFAKTTKEEAVSEAPAKAGEEVDELNLYAQSAVLMDAKSGRILYGKNETLARPMASTTKIMTCILALESGNLSDTVTASQNAAAQPKVHLGVYKGETFRLEDLLYSLMLESHNDAAMMIAEHIGGSREGFAAMMNQKARDLGCKDTWFITPNGLDARENAAGQEKEHSTTAADLCRIMNYCIGQSPKKEEFLKITGTQSYSFSDLEGKRSFGCNNHNALLSMMSGAFSGKTGFTGGAGYSYVGAVNSDGRVFTIALLGCGWPPHKTWKWADARKLFQYGMDQYHYREVYEEPELPEILVKNGIPESGSLEEKVFVPCGLEEREEKSLKLLLSEEEKVEISMEIARELEAPALKGQPVGEIVYRLDGEVVKTYPVYLEKGAKKITRSWCFKNVIRRYLEFDGAALLGKVS